MKPNGSRKFFIQCVIFIALPLLIGNEIANHNGQVVITAIASGLVSAGLVVILIVRGAVSE